MIIKTAFSPWRSGRPQKAQRAARECSPQSRGRDCTQRCTTCKITKIEMSPSTNSEKSVLSTRTRSRWWQPCLRVGNPLQADRRPEESTCHKKVHFSHPLALPSCILAILGRDTEVGPQPQKVQRDKEIWEIMGAFSLGYRNLEANLQPLTHGRYLYNFSGNGIWSRLLIIRILICRGCWMVLLKFFLSLSGWWGYWDSSRKRIFCQ